MRISFFIGQLIFGHSKDYITEIVLELFLVAVILTDDLNVVSQL